MIKKNLKFKIFFIFFFLVSSFSFTFMIYLYHKDSTYEKILKIKNSLSREKIIGKLYFFGFKTLRYTYNEFDVVRIYHKIKYEEPESTNLQMSSSDLADIKSQIKVFKKKGFIKDELNYWRKAKLIVGNQEFKIRYKFHGTSISPLKKASIRFVLVNKEGKSKLEVYTVG